jgi:hypothetical protein
MIKRSYVMEAIISHKKALRIKGGYKYQIKWEGYNDDEITGNQPPISLLDKYKKQHGLGETKVQLKRKG